MATNTLSNGYSSSYHTVEVGHVKMNLTLDILETFGDFRDADQLLIDKLKKFIDVYDKSYQFISPAQLKDITIQMGDYYLKIDMTKDEIVVRKYVLNTPTSQS